MTVEERILDAEQKLAPMFDEIDKIALFNQEKVLNAFREERIALRHFMASTGYGYGDEGRESLGKVYAHAFGAERSIVSPAILSGTHALTVALFGVLRPGNRVLCVSGVPYDTLRGVVWGKGNGSLADFGITFETVPLDGFGKIDLSAVRKALQSGSYDMVYLQRSRGYELRDSFTIDEISEA